MPPSPSTELVRLWSVREKAGAGLIAVSPIGNDGRALFVSEGVFHA